ncbi:MAG: discoidin domain-containing protein [Bacteroidaceae bacterium]|nr:discoidin domain-containing protein [Bacteroidaceae bacterium]
MKKFYLILAALFTFAGITTAQAQDDEEYVLEVNGNTGDWTKSSSPAYGSEWTSTFKDLGTDVIIQEPNQVNNMNLYDGTNIQFYNSVGSSGQSRTYVIKVSNVGYYIAGVSFDFKPGKHPNFEICAMSVSIDDVEATAQVGETVSFVYTNDVNDVTSVNMIVSSDDASHHAFAATTNFMVTLRKRPGLDAAWDRLNSIVDSYTIDAENLVTDGTPGSYGEAEKEAYIEALNYVHELEGVDDLTEEMLDQHGQVVIQAYEALLASKITTYDVADGYYRFRPGLIYNTGEKYMYAYEQGTYHYAMWATPEDGDAADAIAILWKVTKKTKGYDVVPAVYPTMHFNPVSVTYLNSNGSVVPSLTENGAAEMVFSPQATIDGVTYFNMYASADDPAGRTIYHQGGHSSGNGQNGLVITWYPTYTDATGPGASEWYLEPVDDAEAEAIIAAYEPIRQQKELTKAYTELKTTAEKELEESKELVLTELITDNSQFSSPFTCSADEEPAAKQGTDKLIDGDKTTYWHSTWAATVENHTHYLQVELPQEGYAELRMSISRRPVANDHITLWGVVGSNDPDAADEAWVEVASLETPFGNNTETKTADFDCKGYKYLRFYIDGTTTGRGYGHVSEFQLYTMEQAPTSQYAIIGEPAENLDKVLAEQADVNADEVTQEEYDALKAAYDAFKAEYVDPTELREVIAKAEAFVDGIVIGTNPGTWNSGSVADQLQQIVADAKAYDEAKIYKQATSQDFIAKINAQLEGIVEAANAIKTDTWYRFRFGSEATFAANGWDTEAGAAVISSEDESVQDEALWDKYITAARAEENEGVRSVVPIYTDEARLGQGLFVDALEEIQDAELAQFRFIAVGDTAYVIQNRATGLFVKAAGTTGGVTLDLHPTLFNVAPMGFGFNLFSAKDLEGAKQNYLHVARNYNQLVTWDASTVGSRSSLLIEEVGSAAGYTEPGFYMEVLPGALYAMCYPVDITVEEGNGALYSVEKVEGTHVTFAAIDKVEAGRPFVYKNGEVEEFNPENTPDIVKLHHGYDIAAKPEVSSTFAGTYVQKTLGAGYIVTGKALRDIGGVYAGEYALNELFITRSAITNGVNAHGAYIIPEEGATGAVTFDFDGTEDGIVIATDDARRNGKVYSIDGRVIGTAGNLRGVAKGLYIVNGTKVLVK